MMAHKMDRMHSQAEGDTVKRISSKIASSILCCLLLTSGSSAPAFAQTFRGKTSAHPTLFGPGSGLRAHHPALNNPALPGGVSSIKGTLAPAAENEPAPGAEQAQSAAAPAPAAAAPELTPELRDSLGAFLTRLEQTQVGEKGQIEALRKVLEGDASEASLALAKIFREGSFGASAAAPVAEPVANDGSALSTLYPKVVFIQDVFKAAASETTVEYVNKLVDAGVHVVFLTWRPQKGAGSADEILLSRVKQSRNNPIVVVSHNGGKISLHGRAANPKSLIEDIGNFKPETLASVKAQAEAVAAEIGGTVAFEAEEEAFSATLRFTPPAEAKFSAAQAAQSLNDKLQALQLKQFAEPHPTEAGALIIHSMPLRYSLGRVNKALDQHFAGEKLLESPEKFLILADSVKSPKFVRGFPRKSTLQVVRGGDDVENILGAALGDRSLEPVALKLSKLRQFVEYWEPSHSRVPAPAASAEKGGGSGFGFRRADRATHQKFSMYVGSILSTLLAQMYEDIFQGQDHLAQRSTLQARLEQLWYNPFKAGVFVGKGLADVMGSPAWKTMSRGYLGYARAYLDEFYTREFGDYSRAAANVRHNFVGLSTDRKSLITIVLKSAATGKLYKIYTRIPRVMKSDTAEGFSLTATAYRTGKETPDGGEEFLARMHALAMLFGYGRKGDDGRWHMGTKDGKVISSLRVKLEYRSSAREHIFSTDEFLGIEEGKEVNGPLVQEIISAIDRSEADAAFQEHYAKEQEEAKAEDVKRKRAAEKAAKAPMKKAPAKKITAKLKPKPAKLKPARRKG